MFFYVKPGVQIVTLKEEETETVDVREHYVLFRAAQRVLSLRQLHVVSSED